MRADDDAPYPTRCPWCRLDSVLPDRITGKRACVVCGAAEKG